MKNPKIVAGLGALAALAGSALFVFDHKTNAVQQVVSTNEVVLINVAGVVLMFVGFYFVLTLIPVPKIKK